MKQLILSSILIPFLSNSVSYACDLCSIYNAHGAQDVAAGTARFSVAEQFAYYGTIQEEGHFRENEFKEHFSSSITQLGATYGMTPALALQLTVPIVERRFRRLEEGQTTRGSLGGLGDMSLLIRGVPYLFNESGFRAKILVSAGLKLPTGDSDRLAEQEHHEEMTEHDENLLLAHHDDEEPGVPPSAVHNHDLALGSGSLDFPFAAHADLWWERIALNADLAYTLRTEGDHNYEFGDDIMWSLAPGYLVNIGAHSSILFSFGINGEIKAKDRQAGAVDGDTRLRTVFVGPHLGASLGESVFLECGLDLPVSIDNSGTQAVADYRVRAGLAVRL